jgi:hypothetical protein
MGRKDFNALERTQLKKVSIASDDVCSMAAHREFQELVVLRIATSLYPRPHVNPFRLARQRRKNRSNLFLVHIAAEPLSAQDSVEFGDRQEGNQHSSFAKSLVKCLSRF